MMFRFAMALLAGLSGIVLASCSSGQSSGGGLYAKGKEKLPYTFYRMQSSYIVKATGEEIEFDYVAACGGTVTRWRSGSPSVMSIHHPLMMFKPTSDGAAVGIRTIDMCEQWKWEPDRDGNSRIPDDLLPMTLWYPKVEDMGFALGYESDVAYESPYSKLIFKGAKLTQTDEAAWQAWRQKAEATYQQVGALPGPWGFSFEHDPDDYYDAARARGYIAGRGCNSALRLEIPEEVKAETFSLLPEKYGRYVDTNLVYENEDKELAYEIRRVVVGAPPKGSRKLAARPIYNGSSIGPYRPSIRELGVLTRSNGGRVRHIAESLEKRYVDLYPMIYSRPDLPATEDTLPDYYIRDILIKPEWNGFSGCSSKLVSIPELEAYSKGETSTLTYYGYGPGVKATTAEGAVLYNHFINGELFRERRGSSQKPRTIIDRQGNYISCCRY